GFDQAIDRLVEPVRQRGIELRLRVAKACAPKQLHDASGFRAKRRDPVGGRRGSRRSDLLHRSTEEADDADPDASDDCAGEGLTASDAVIPSWRGGDLLFDWCEAHELH